MNARCNSFDPLDDAAVGREQAAISGPPKPLPPSIEAAKCVSTTPPVLTIDGPAHDAAITGKRRIELQDVLLAPPENVALKIERLARIDPGMNKEQRAIVRESGAAQRRHQFSMAGAGFDRGTEPGGPARQRQHPVARGGKTLPRIDAVRGERLVHAVIEHPGQHLARIGRELQLGGASATSLPGCRAGRRCRRQRRCAGRGTAGEENQRIERRCCGRTVAEEIAEIDQPVAGIEARRQPRMQGDDAMRLAVNRRDRPDAPRARKPAIDFRICKAGWRPTPRRSLVGP